MESLFKGFGGTGGGVNELTLHTVLWAVGLVAAVYLVAVLIVWLVNRRINDVVRRHNARKLVMYTTTLLVVAVLAVKFIVPARWNLQAIVAILGAGLVVALGRPILSVAGWFFILIRRPYVVGDRIQIGETAGDVIDIRIFMTSVLEIGKWVHADQSTLRIVHIPNAEVFSGPIHNYTAGFGHIWNEMSVAVTFESDWRRAEALMLEPAQREAERIEKEAQALIKKAAKKYSIYYPRLTPIVYVRIVDFGVELTLRYLTNARRRRSTEDELTRQVLESFNAEPTVAFAYPTYRLVSTSGVAQGDRQRGSETGTPPATGKQA